MNVIRSILWYSIFFIGLVAKTPKFRRLRKEKDSMSNEEYLLKVNQVVKNWTKPLIKICGARFHITGYENIPEENVLFVSNHQGNFDPAIFMYFIDKPKGYVAKSELLKAPFLRTWMKHLNCIFIDRTDIKKSAKALTEGIDILKSGYSLVVFPEGTRSKGDDMGEFKSGSFRLATKSKVPIVPVSISGSYKIIETNKNIIKPADVYVTIHPPVYTDKLSREDEIALPEKIKTIIGSKL